MPLLVGFKCFLHECIHSTPVSDFVIQKPVCFNVSYDKLTRIRLLTMITAAATTRVPSITKTKYKIEVFLKGYMTLFCPIILNNSKPSVGDGFYDRFTPLNERIAIGKNSQKLISSPGLFR